MGLSDVTIAGRQYAFTTALESQLAKNSVGLMAWRAKSDQKTETYEWLGQIPALREWVGSRLGSRPNVFDYSLTNQKWEDTIGIQREDFERQKFQVIDARIADLAVRAAQHPVKLLSNLVKNGDDATGSDSFDGTRFFGDVSNPHAIGSGASFINDVTVTQVPALNIGTATKPTVDEMSAAILDTIAYLFTYQDDQGEPTNGDANEFLVYVPPQFVGATAGALGNNTLLQGGVNTLKTIKWKIEMIVDPRLDWTTEFAIFRTDTTIKSLIFQVERDVRLRTLTFDSEHAFKTDEYLFGVDGRYTMGYGIPWYAIKATFN